MDIGASFVGKDVVCPVCGKTFLLTSGEWVYRIMVNKKQNKYKYVCSWRCRRKWEKKNGK